MTAAVQNMKKMTIHLDRLERGGDPLFFQGLDIFMSRKRNRRLI